jgi:uncharacterized protein
MRISGAATMHAPAGQVWAALTDPAILAATIPGCERFEPAGPDTYRFTVTAAVASLQASYAGEVSLSQQQEPVSFVLTARGAGAPGTVTTSVQITLADVADGTTELSYDADAMIGGLIAGVGQRMLCSVAKRLAGAFFTSVDDTLAGAPPAEAGPVPEPAVPEPTVPEPAVPELTVPEPTVPEPTVPELTAPEPAVPVASGRASPERLAGASPAPERRTESPGFPQDGGFARGMLAGAGVTLAGVTAARLIRRYRLTGRGAR